MACIHLKDLKSFSCCMKMTVGYFVFVYLTDGICSRVLLTLRLLQYARLKIQDHGPVSETGLKSRLK